jgi:hypothetical protein
MGRALSVAFVLGVLLLAVLYSFVTFEQTAIPTVPRAAAQDGPHEIGGGAVC